ncbi:unnamed protein product [Parascedosporium putredinis]|uniref:Uncharacterized protein n=1 Tax=Parascedosporium putredinis TaxID=1442378 RepID=A0A9P1MCA3_9PEZI|nr:unnamed protein product [Parascedosporium putredinis]CAI8001203.1 unnamed protein product [Parascedosporium putredinis]
MSAIAELEAGLTAMLQFKPPGVSTSRIKALTDLCQKNIKDESLIVQKFYTHFKKAPGTHKLGVLYLIDSVVRKWVEQAKHNSQEISSSAQDGTFAAGVFRVTEIVPALMDNIVQTAPVDQKDRVKKLVDIWERAQTFPPNYITKFRKQLTQGAARSPPANLPGSELVARAYSQIPQQPFATNHAAAHTSSASNYASQFLASLNPTQNLGAPPLSAPAYPAAMNSVPTPTPPQASAPGAGAPSIDQVMFIKTLVDQGLKPEQISVILQAMSAAPAAAAPAAVPTMPAFNQPQNAGWGLGAHASHDYDASGRRGYGDRSRSKSPDRWGSGRDSRGGQDRHASRRSTSRDRGSRDRGDYRQRSPMGRRGSPPGHNTEVRKKWVEIDSSMRPGHIKVLSRTLFVGGVTCTQSELQDLFGRVGKVQSVIINKEKRHAFVKMLTREGAVVAKETMGEYKSGGLALRTRWGVGFGPRDCCDYETGISLIPIARLTEADRKWLLTAEYGTDKGGAHGPKSSRPREDEFQGQNSPGQGHGHGRGDRNRHRDTRRDDNANASNRDGQFQNPLNPNLIPQVMPTACNPCQPTPVILTLKTILTVPKPKNRLVRPRRP